MPIVLLYYLILKKDHQIWGVSVNVLKIKNVKTFAFYYYLNAKMLHQSLKYNK